MKLNLFRYAVPRRVASRHAVPRRVAPTRQGLVRASLFPLPFPDPLERRASCFMSVVVSHHVPRVAECIEFFFSSTSSPSSQRPFNVVSSLVSTVKIVSNRRNGALKTNVPRMWPTSRRSYLERRRYHHHVRIGTPQVWAKLSQLKNASPLPDDSFIFDRSVFPWNVALFSILLGVNWAPNARGRKSGREVEARERSVSELRK